MRRYNINFVVKIQKRHYNIFIDNNLDIYELMYI